MLVKCPNCNRDTFNDYKCQYCRWVLNPKPNPYEKEIYEDLKADYLHSRNKAETIKNGIKKHNKSMQEIKEIVDFIADEIYDIENYKSKESFETERIVEPQYSHRRGIKKYSLIWLVLSILSAICCVISATTSNKIIAFLSIGAFLILLGLFAVSLKPEKIRQTNTFYYSFRQYFIHDMIYKIILLSVLCCAPVCFREHFFNDGSILFVWIWYLLVFLLLLRFLFKWAESSTSSIAIESDKITYQFQKSNHSLHGEQGERFYYLNWANYVEYNIQSISHVVETITSFVIYGDIKRKQFYVKIGNVQQNCKTKVYKKIVIRKCFKNHAILIEELRKRMKNTTN